MKLRFTRQATQDLNSIADYVSERNPKAALRVRAAIVESLQTLVLFCTSVGDRRLKVSASS
jgi:plasmid stabilization system protein ParE